MSECLPYYERIVVNKDNLCIFDSRQCSLLTSIQLHLQFYSLICVSNATVKAFLLFKILLNVEAVLNLSILVLFC